MNLIEILSIGLELLVVFATTATTGNIFSRTFQELHEDPGPQASARAWVQTKWIDQKLDHFNESELRTWQMRYLANDEFYEKGGPMFIYVGGEWTISPGAISRGHHYDMAKEHQGYLFYTEHRYYGQSKPVKDLSPDNMQYLHVRQALADLAHFIRVMKVTIPGMENSKVILTGGSYSATMVTWFKKLYPELATGCWASSAPLLAKRDFLEYKEVTGDSIRLLGGDSCYDRIQKAILELEAMISNNRSPSKMKCLLKICDNFNESNEMDVWTLFSQISDIFAGVVQNHSNNTIQKACSKIMEGEDDIGGLLNFLAPYFKGNKNCTEFSYDEMVKAYNYTSFDKGMYRQWFYQTCNEYGWYQSSGSKNQPFGSKFPAKLYTQLCYDEFGEKFTEEFIENQIKATNQFFGALEPKVENVYMTHGQLDPWRAMGVQEEGKATIIPLVAHCRDFGSINDKDTPELRASKEKLAELVREWLK
ncbi:putative serine protease K12H4.7 [Stomoxys calcitrans]|uniref:putative serine protease K12H4.7 n=1 Tax=Stomoxys calcitrans TaxID=35570 RepID=UPI0027E368D6|nr:putative serine protease K12H4.7 [Stomoxys calcitrans]